MSTINYIRLCKSLGVEDLEPKVGTKSFPRKKLDPDVVAKDLREARSLYRSNMCERCFSARASNGSCNCD